MTFLQLDDFIQRTAVSQTFLHRDFANPAILVFAMENIDQKTLFVAFTPGQAADLGEGRGVFPQETSERFGLRTTKEEAIERAHYFHKWHSENVDTSQEEIPKKGFVIATIRLSASGYLARVENGTLIKTRGKSSRCQESLCLFGFRTRMSPALNNFCHAGKTNTCPSSMSWRRYQFTGHSCSNPVHTNHQDRTESTHAGVSK